MRTKFFLVLHDCGSPEPRECTVKEPSRPDGFILVALNPPFPGGPAYSPDRPVSEMLLGFADPARSLAELENGLMVVSAFVPKPLGHPSEYPLWRISTGTIHRTRESALRHAPFEAFFYAALKLDNRVSLARECLLLDKLRTSDGREYLSVFLIPGIPGQLLGDDKEVKELFLAFTEGTQSLRNLRTTSPCVMAWTIGSSDKPMKPGSFDNRPRKTKM